MTPLSDCIIAIKNAGGYAAIGSEGKILANLANTKRPEGSYCEMYWDLQLPFLHQQSEELGQTLLNLLS